MITGFLVTMEAFPYAFATADVTSLPTVAAGYTLDWSTNWTLLSGALDWSEGVSWSQRSRSDGSLESNSLTFTLHDVVPASGEAAGQNVCTYLMTRRPALIGSTRLTTSVAAVAVGTLVVGSVAALNLGGFPTTVWVDREAIRVSGSADDQHLTVAGSGQGYYGSILSAHTVDSGNLVYPTVWGAFPTTVRRRVILWAVDDTNTATPIWRGTVGTGLTLAPDGAAYSLQCEGIWTLTAGQKVGTPTALCRFSGYWGVYTSIAIYRDGTYIGGANAHTAHYRDLASAFAAARANTITALHAGGVDNIGITFMPAGDSLRFTIVSATGSEMRVEIHAGAPNIVGGGTSSGGGGAPVVTGTMSGLPAAALRSQVGSYQNYFPCDTTAELPTDWSSHDYTDSGFATHVKASLRAPYSAEEWVVFDVTGTGYGTSTSSAPFFTGPYVAGNFAFAPRDNSGVVRTARVGENLAQGDLRAQAITVVDTEHFAAGLKHILDASTPLLGSRTDARDWDWSQLSSVIAATVSPYCARHWEIDGTLTVGDLVKEVCAVNGLGLALRAGGRLGLIAIGPATPHSTVAATLGEGDLLDSPTFQQLAEEQITAIETEAPGGGKTTVHNTTTENTYGAGRTVKVQLEGQRTTATAISSYQDFVRYLLSRVQGPYAEPIACLTIKVAASQWMTTILPGDYVDVSEWLAPDGAGGRGVGNSTALAAFHASTQRAQVVGWAVDLAPNDSGNTLTLDLLLFAQVRGYAPACKIASSGSTTSVVTATAYIGTLGGSYVGDYADPDAGTSDGGASKFAVNDRVQFRQMNTTSNTVHGPYTIQAISGTTITFTGAIDAGMRTSIAGGDWWDLEYASASDVVGGTNETSQFGYAFVGNAGTGVIGGTSYVNQPWAP